MRTPNLFAFKSVFKDMEYEFKYPNAITYLIADECSPLIEQFLNLEYLIAKKFNRINSQTLLKLNKLKEIHNIGYSIVFGFNDLNLFHRLYDEKANSSLQLFISGLNFELFREIRENNFGSFYSRNYSQLITRLIWEEKFVFNKFEFVNDRIPEDFFCKFPNLKQVLCERTKKEALFLDFLKKCIHLDNLHLDLMCISPANYVKLPDCCPFLTCLELFISKPIELNFVF